MSSPSQKRGSCGHIMASFDSHNFCARCREKGKGSDPCTSKNDCNSCNVLTEEQRLQLSTPSYRIKKEKRDLKKSSDTPKQDSSTGRQVPIFSYYFLFFNKFLFIPIFQENSYFFLFLVMIMYFKSLNVVDHMEND